MCLNNEKIIFDDVFKYGKKIVGKYLIAYIKENNSDCIKSGVIVSKKVGNAVIRNRIKRIVREAVRIINKKTSYNVDVILISKHSNGNNNSLKTDDIVKDINNIFRRR